MSTIATILTIWLTASIPFSLLIGKYLKWRGGQ